MGFPTHAWSVLLWASVALSDHTFEAVAPLTASFLEDYLRSDDFTSAMHACFPNATNPDPAFDGQEAPAPSHCLLNANSMVERVQAIGEGMANADVILELERLSQGSIRTHLMMDLDWEAAIIASFTEVFFNGNQFKQGQQPSNIRPRFWVSPSPIGRLSSPDVKDPNAPSIVLGGTCSEENVGGLASLKLDFTYDERVNQGQGGSQASRAERRRKLLRTRPSVIPNITDVVIDVRIAESGPTAVTGVGTEAENSQWENAIVAENLQQSDTQQYPGQPYPRTHLLLFYRVDWFRELNLSVPNTWEELIVLAEALPGVAGFEGSSGEARPEDTPDWDFSAFPDLKFTPMEPQEVLQALPHDMTNPQERAATNGSSPRYALCLDLAPRCKSSWLFNAIFASLSQARGIWQGAYIDPVDTQFLGQKYPELVKEALQLFHRITKASHQPSSVHSCAIVNPMFASGACAMTVEWDVFFPYFYNKVKLAGVPPEESSPYASELVGNLGVAPLPGSARVYDRKEKRMVDCDVPTCPMATSQSVAEYQRVVAQDGSLGMTAQFSDVLVNRAPLSVNIRAEIIFCNVKEGGSTPGLNIPKLDAASRVVNGIIMPVIAIELFRGFVLKFSLEAMGPDIMRAAYGLVTKHDVDGLQGLYKNHPALEEPPEIPSAALQSWWAPNISTASPLYTGAVALTGIYLDVTDSKRYFDALWKARYTYRNQAPELWVTRLLTLAYRHAVDETAVYATAAPDFSLQAGAEYFQKRCNDSRAVEVRSTSILQEAIWYTTGFDESMIDAPPDESDGSRDWVAGAIAGPVVAFVLGVLGLALAIFFFRRAKRRHLNWLGKILPPKAGRETTLVCTDIENSTQMWELLPESVCDHAMTLHNQVIRSVLSRHLGYESGTEGDAFVLAFHSVRDAVMFSSEAQQRLLLAPWPEELFELELFRPVYVQPNIPQSLKTNHSRNMPVVLIDPLNLLEPSGSEVGIEGAQQPPKSSPIVQDVYRPADQSRTIQDGSGVSWWSQFRAKLMMRAEPAERQVTAEKDSARQCVLRKGFTPRRSEKTLAPVYQKEDTRKEVETRESPGISGLLSMDTAIVEAFKSEASGGQGVVTGGRTTPPQSTPGLKLDKLDNPLYTAAEASALVASSHLPNLELEQTTQAWSSAGQVTLSCPSDRSLTFLNPTVGQRLIANCPPVDAPAPGRLLILRGLRVRMGMGTGVERQEDVQLNGAHGRLKYGGRAMANARAIVDAAQGGQILIGPESFQQLPPQQGIVLVVSMGEHVLTREPEETALQLYQVLPHTLCARAAHLGCVRSLHPLSLGFLSAPASAAAVCYLNVSCLHALRLWNPEVTCKSLALFYSTVQDLLTKRGGYLVEASDGLCLTAFTHPAAAIRWAVDSLNACMYAEWPPELLSNELGEEQRIAQPRICRVENAGASFSTKAHAELEEKLVFRGLRLKVGIDWGSVRGDIHPAIARVSFRGKVMNRAARVSCFAKSGQVLCTERAWCSALTDLNATCAEDKGRDRAVSAYFVGSHKLKGLQDAINLFQCIGSEEG